MRWSVVSSSFQHGWRHPIQSLSRWTLLHFLMTRFSLRMAKAFRTSRIVLIRDPNIKNIQSRPFKFFDTDGLFSQTVGQLLYVVWVETKSWILNIFEYFLFFSQLVILRQAVGESNDLAWCQFLKILEDHSLTVIIIEYFDHFIDLLCCNWLIYVLEVERQVLLAYVAIFIQIDCLKCIDNLFLRKVVFETVVTSHLFIHHNMFLVVVSTVDGFLSFWAVDADLYLGWLSLANIVHSVLIMVLLDLFPRGKVHMAHAIGVDVGDVLELAEGGRDQFGTCTHFYIYIREFLAFSCRCMFCG